MAFHWKFLSFQIELTGQIRTHDRGPVGYSAERAHLHAPVRIEAHWMNPALSLVERAFEPLELLSNLKNPPKEIAKLVTFVCPFEPTGSDNMRALNSWDHFSVLVT